MKLLLDTHALVWALVSPSKLTARMRQLLSDRRSQVLVSAACAYEIEFKRSRSEELSRLPLDLEEGVALMEFDWLSIGPLHALAAGRLPRLHGDPFDRIIVAQGLIEQATVVSRDPALAAYGAPTIW